MKLFTFRSFKQKLRYHKRAYLRLLSRLEKNPPKNIQSIVKEAGANVWDEVDCLACANCCKNMTPTYTEKDMKRIAAYLKMSVGEMKKKWLLKEKGTGDWINNSTPCQFLDLKTNLCTIYEVRPADCANFPHLTKKKVVDYLYVYKQNVDECPATFKMVEKMEEILKNGKK